MCYPLVHTQQSRIILGDQLWAEAFRMLAQWTLWHFRLQIYLWAILVVQLVLNAH